MRANKLSRRQNVPKPIKLMKPNQKLSLLITLASLAVVSASQAQSIVYDNLGTSATAGYSEANTGNPIFGDALGLSQGGQLDTVGLSIYNSSSGGNTGSILAGTVTIKIYDNTAAYAGGALSTLPLLGSATESLSFGGGLAPGFFSTATFDLSSLNINLPQNIFITQQFSETSGTSLRNGVILFGNPTTGSSPASVYINSSATPEGLYTFSGGNPNQFGYQITIVPEPSTLVFAGIGIAVLVLRKRK
jgi:hypothetical protein